MHIKLQYSFYFRWAISFQPLKPCYASFPFDLNKSEISGSPCLPSAFLYSCSFPHANRQQMFLTRQGKAAGKEGLAATGSTVEGRSTEGEGGREGGREAVSPFMGPL